MQLHLVTLLFFKAAFIAPLWSQPDIVPDSTNSQKQIFTFGAGASNGFIIVHTQDVAFTKGSRPLGIELNASWQRNDSATLNICNCYPRKGVVVSYFNMGNEKLGNIYAASFFLEPTYKLGRNSFFSFKAVIGAAYGTNPYDSIENPVNHAYSTHLNAYLMLGTGLSFRLNDNFWLNTSLNFNHVSNGGMHLPNKGVDWPTANLILRYQLHPAAYYAGERKKSTSWKNNSIRWDATFFGIAEKTVDVNKKQRFFPLVGVEFLGSKQIGNLNALSLGTEIFTDPAHALQAEANSSVSVSPIRAGLLFGHEFLLGKFIFSQRLGIYYFSQMPYDRIYHRWAFAYKMDKHWGIGFSLLAHRQVANFFNLKATYSWQRRNDYPGK